MSPATRHVFETNFFYKKEEKKEEKIYQILKMHIIERVEYVSGRLHKKVRKSMCFLPSTLK